MKFYLDAASAVFALVAAGLWFRSVRVKLPSEFPLRDWTKHFVDAEMPSSGPIDGIGESEEIDNLGRGLLWQSKLSSWAAMAAGAAALCQAAVVIFDKNPN